ncbi:MAG TPA: ribonuclease III [Pyrinomonadaceae bacterium]|jgi:ribonuclease-3|nr:ribonuclease III [Pyrinomonadaceae bacterium]
MKPAKLEKSIGYSFKSPELLERALTHRSWAHENIGGEHEEKMREAENESLEFVGDSVLGLAIAEQLFRKHPTLSEGDLTLMKHRLVSTPTLALIAAGLELGDHLRMSRGEEKTGGREKPAILADTLEAVIAAVFFDSGYVEARALIARLFADEIKDATPKASVDYKTLLQETLQAAKLAAPVYSLLSTDGPPHERTFHVAASWESGRSEGTGSSIKAAEMMAASRALKAIEDADGNSPKRTES